MLAIVAGWAGVTLGGDYPLSTEVFTGPMGWKYRTITSGTYAGRVVLVGHVNSATMTEAIVYANYNLSTTYNDHRRVHALDRTFYNWPNLKTVHISMGVIELNGTFENCENLENVYFHNDGQTWWDNGAATTTIGDNTFRNCKSLKQFILPGPTTTWASSLTTIGYRAFSGCTSLTSIDFTSPYSVPLLQSIGNNAFEGCTGLVEAKIGGDGQQGLALGKSLFNGCTGLKTAILGPAVASIATEEGSRGGGMFSGCANLEKVELQTVRLSGIPKCFCDTSGIKILELPQATYAEDAYRTIGDYAFANCPRLEAICEKEVSGKFKPVEIGKYAFGIVGSGYNSMTGRIDFSRCTTIGDCAFYYCTNFPGDLDLRTVTSLGVNVFTEARAITSVRLENLTGFSSSPFRNCIALTNAFIGGSVDLEYGGSGTAPFLNGCTNLRTVTFGPRVSLASRSIGSSNPIFYECDRVETVEFRNETALDIPVYCFYGLEELRRVKFAGGVASVGVNAFGRCKKLEAIEGVFAPKDVGDSAFNECQLLENTENFDLSQCTNIGYQAFNYCTNFGGALALTAAKSISQNAFLYCKSLERVEMGAVTNVGVQAFRYCEKLTEVSFPETLEKIDGSALQNSPALTKITFAGEPPAVVGNTGGKLTLNCSQQVTVEYPEAHAAAWSEVTGNSFVQVYGGGSAVIAQVATPVPPDAGFADFVRIKMGNAGMTEEECQAKLEEVGANGYTWYASYVAGLDPGDAGSKFVATIEFGEDGLPVVECEPVVEGRVYRKFGKVGLGDAEWTELGDGVDVSGFRFFRVTVELP